VGGGATATSDASAPADTADYSGDASDYVATVVATPGDNTGLMIAGAAVALVAGIYAFS
jgi:hypothetical protein